MWSGEYPFRQEGGNKRSRNESSASSELKATNARLNYLTRYVVRLRDEITSLKQTVSMIQSSTQSVTAPPPQTVMIPAPAPILAVTCNGTENYPNTSDGFRSIGSQFPEPIPDDVFEPDPSDYVSEPSTDMDHSPQRSPERPTHSWIRQKKAKRMPVFRPPVHADTPPSGKRKKRRSHVIPLALRPHPRKGDSSRASVSSVSISASEARPRRK